MVAIDCIRESSCGTMLRYGKIPLRDYSNITAQNRYISLVRWRYTPCKFAMSRGIFVPSLNPPPVTVYPAFRRGTGHRTPICSRSKRLRKRVSSEHLICGSESQCKRRRAHGWLGAFCGQFGRSRLRHLLTPTEQVGFIHQKKALETEHEFFQLVV